MDKPPPSAPPILLLPLPRRLHRMQERRASGALAPMLPYRSCRTFPFRSEKGLCEEEDEGRLKHLSTIECFRKEKQASKGSEGRWKLC